MKLTWIGVVSWLLSENSRWRRDLGFGRGIEVETVYFFNFSLYVFMVLCCRLGLKIGFQVCNLMGFEVELKLIWGAFGCCLLRLRIWLFGL